MQLIYARALPLRIYSEANTREHWRIASARHKRQKSYITSMLPDLVCPQSSVVVRLVRVAPRAYDDDNVVAAFKYIRDAVAEVINPGKRAGMADNDPRIKWEYAQEKGKIGIRIELYG